MDCRAFVLAGALVLGGPALATDARVPTAQPQKDRLICKTEDQLGSRLRKAKRCYTAREWEDYTRQRREATQELQRGGSRCTLPNPDLC